MRGFATGVLMVVRVLWLVNIVLGILFWTGHLLNLIPVHMLVGLLFSLGVLTLGVVAATRRAWGQAVAGIVMALLLPFVGLSQDSWLPGGAHWVIKVLHLLVAVVAIATAESIAGALRRSGTSAEAKA